ncbi:MAG: radical SAM protein [Spirochaetaceae bacterium]
MNKYLDINRVEFLITGNCTSNCKHCSNSNVGGKSQYLTLEKGKKILDSVKKEYQLNSVMVFGGEPLLYPETTIQLLKYAKKLNIPNRQIITNAFWTKDRSKIDKICQMLKDADVNDILISIDSFHDEHLDYDLVEYAVSKLSKLNFPNIKLHPCWYISKDDNNKYDTHTNNLLENLAKYGIPRSDGNTLFAAGNAVKNFPNRFKPLDNIKHIDCGKLPYTESPKLLESIGIDPDGKVSSLCFGQSIEIEDFLENYDPYSDEVMSLFLEQGVTGLTKLADQKGITFSISDYYSICDACTELRNKLSDIS